MLLLNLFSDCYDLFIFCVSGSPFTCNIVVAPVKNSDGDVTMVVLNFESKRENSEKHKRRGKKFVILIALFVPACCNSNDIAVGAKSVRFDSRAVLIGHCCLGDNSIAK